MPALVSAKAPRFETADAMRAHYTVVGKRLGKPLAAAKLVVITLPWKETTSCRREVSERRQALARAFMGASTLSSPGRQFELPATHPTSSSNDHHALCA
jgi:hypothetical protein